MRNDLDLIPTGSQTVGPFFHLGCTDPFSVPVIAGPLVKGEHIKLICTLHDGQGSLLPDAMIEIWQANAEGRYHHPEDAPDPEMDSDFRGFGRLAAAWPIKPDGVNLIEIDEGTITMRDIAQLADRRDVAVHRIDGFERD